MRVHLSSDLHLNFADCTLTGGDVLVLAGDVFEAGLVRRAENAGKDTHILDRYHRFASTELTKYDRVLYVFGNHEYYNHDYSSARDRIQGILPPNVEILENTWTKIDGVVFWGATMWTSFDGNPVIKQTVEAEMSDYKYIRWDPARLKPGAGGQYWSNRFTADDSEQIHRVSRTRLEEFLLGNPDQQTVVVTHHAPSYQSVQAEYRDHVYGAINRAYYTELSDLMFDHPQLTHWFHGHMHAMNDYQLGSCRVVSRPRGYARYESQAQHWEYIKGLPIEI